MPKTKSTNSKGFTLIELLISIMLVGILSGLLLTVINPSGLRAKARDSQRKSDLKKIQTALELHFADFRRYPISSAWIQVNETATVTTELEAGYINKVPLDPELSGTNNGPCTFSDNYRYTYRTDATGSVYILTALMEISTSDEESKCTALNTWTSLGCTSGDTYNDPSDDICYGVENP